MIFNTNKAEREAIKELSNMDLDIPLNVEQLAKEQYGLEVVYDDDLDNSVSGMLILKGQKKFIVVNNKHPENRQRFTIAHELGHFILHRNKQKVFIDDDCVFNRSSSASEGTYRVEIEANSFAAELLMPKTKIYELIRNESCIGDDAINRLAKLFRVSSIAFKIRLINLGLLSVSMD